MPATAPTATAAFQDASRDILGLLILLRRHVTEDASHGLNWADAGSMQALRAALIEALIPTRNCQIEAEAREEILADLARVRPSR